VSQTITWGNPKRQNGAETQFQLKLTHTAVKDIMYANVKRQSTRIDVMQGRHGKIAP
jgi:hypothetical protein